MNAVGRKLGGEVEGWRLEVYNYLKNITFVNAQCLCVARPTYRYGRICHIFSEKIRG